TVLGQIDALLAFVRERHEEADEAGHEGREQQRDPADPLDPAVAGVDEAPHRVGAEAEQEEAREHPPDTDLRLHLLDLSLENALGSTTRVVVVERLRVVQVEGRALRADARDRREVVTRRRAAGRPLERAAVAPRVVDGDLLALARSDPDVEEEGN